MIKINNISTMFVGIDVSSKSNVVYTTDFDKNKYITSSFSNNQSEADEIPSSSCITSESLHVLQPQLEIQ